MQLLVINHVNRQFFISSVELSVNTDESKTGIGFNISQQAMKIESCQFFHQLSGFFI
jgi:hypothetical protein